MKKLDGYKRRVSQLEDQLDRQLVDIEILHNKMHHAVGAEYLQLAEDLALARMKTDIMRDSLDKAKDVLKTHQVEMQSPEYQDASKRMDAINKDVAKLEKTITKTYNTLRSQLDDVYDLCAEYDGLNSKYRGEVNTWLMSSYRWLAYLHGAVAKLARYPDKIR